jgi:alpha-glucosidase
MFIQKNSKGLEGVFAPYPLQEEMTTGEFPQLIVTQRAGYIASLQGTRMLPWRVIMVAKKDTDLPGNDLLYLLGEPTALKDISWIKPAKGTDEWITGINLFNIPFEAGINTATYKYYIDFAKRFGFTQIMLDAGWSDYKDLFKINPALNMNELAQYARSKGIKLMLWTLCSTLDKQLDSALTQFNQWGVESIMTDFMDRDDQLMVNFYHRIAKACADHHISIMFHGAYPPKGFNRTWPNAITQEGVLGSEWNIWSELATPEHNVALAYTRMLAGPMDYEPGLLLNAQKDQFRPIGKNPMSMGTRCHQLAMFVVYDSPLQIFSGNISQGLREPAFMELLGSLPTTWDETKILQGKIGEFIITARKKGKDWYVAGLNNNTERKIQLSLDFAGKGAYTLTSCRDGLNAHNYGSDYILDTQQVNNSSSISLTMKPGGGFLLRLKAK